MTFTQQKVSLSNPECWKIIKHIFEIILQGRN